MACLYVAREGIRWSALPDSFPPKSTVFYWFQKWSDSGLFKRALRTITRQLERSGSIYNNLCFIDGMFVRSKGGSEFVGKTKCGKGHKMMAIIDRYGFPIAVSVTSASPHESQLVTQTLDGKWTELSPKRLMGDKAYDSDKLDNILLSKGIDMIAPHKCNRKNKTQDGRKLRAYKERWKVEDFNCRIQRFRKIIIKYERKIVNFIGFLHLATLKIAWNTAKRRF